MKKHIVSTKHTSNKVKQHDAPRFPSFVEQELYAWSAGVVAQRFRHGPRWVDDGWSLMIPVLFFVSTREFLQVVFAEFSLSLDIEW